jgi:hypothetical protein
VGNLGFATVTFGDNAGTLTTSSMPVLFYYAITDNTTGAPVSVPVQRGWFGVNDAPGSIDVSGSVQPAGSYPVCDSSAAMTCWVVSVLKYITYAGGARAGFLLTPAPLQDCSIVAPGSCQPMPMLSIGLTDTQEASFSSAPLVCPPTAHSYAGPPNIEGYPVCQSLIDSAAISVSGASDGALSGGFALFDTGTPYMVFDLPQGTVFPTTVAAGSQVQITLPSGFVYTYSSGGALTGALAPYATLVNFGNAGATAETIIGVDYFTAHPFFIDYAAGKEGWK